MTADRARTAADPARPAAAPVRPLGDPRHDLREVGSTNDEARRLALAGAPHGTTVTADRQTAGRGRQGRPWVAPEGRALTASVVLRDLDHLGLLPLAAAVAVAGAVGDGARVKWPNDVVFVDGRGDLRKVAGILCEARPGDGWAVVGVGLNVAVDLDDMPAEVAARAATMGLSAADREPVLQRLLAHLADAVALDPATLLGRWRAVDALAGAAVRWEQPVGTPGGAGVAEGIDDRGRLRVVDGDGRRVLLDAGEVHLVRAPTGA